MNRSKSEGPARFFTDICENFGKIFSFGQLFRSEEDIVKDLYKNIHFMETLELEDPE